MKLAQVDVPTPDLVVKRHAHASNSVFLGLCASKKLTHRKLPAVSHLLPSTLPWLHQVGGQCPTVGRPLPQSSSIGTWGGSAQTTPMFIVDVFIQYQLAEASIGLLLSVMGGA